MEGSYWTLGAGQTPKGEGVLVNLELPFNVYVMDNSVLSLWTRKNYRKQLTDVENFNGLHAQVWEHFCSAPWP
jgi:hypothetical protein